MGLDLDATALAATTSELGPAFVPVLGDVAEWDSHERAADAAASCAPLRAWVNKLREWRRDPRGTGRRPRATPS